VREYEGVVAQLCDRHTLGEGLGLDWNEVSYDQLVAQSVTENTTLNNPQQLSDSLLTITPVVIGLHTFITDRVGARISPNGYAKLGQLAGNAIVRKTDDDGLTAIDGFTTSLPGTGVTLTSGHIAAARSRITSNATEPGPPPFRAVLHGYQMKDLFDELIAGVGTYAVPAGPTASVFSRGFTLPISNVDIYEDGNIVVDATPDVKGGVFSRDALIHVQGRAPWTEPKREPDRGGGGWSVYLYSEYAYGERSAGNWAFEIMSDATAPTS
jgi:hypothetical protein